MFGDVRGCVQQVLMTSFSLLLWCSDGKYLQVFYHSLARCDPRDQTAGCQGPARFKSTANASGARQVQEFKVGTLSRLRSLASSFQAL